MANNKPLPEPPALAIGPTTLSIEARLHRARLLRHLFEDIEEPGVKSKKDGWVYALEEALDELAGAVNSGGWMASLKEARATQDVPQPPDKPVEEKSDTNGIEEKEEPKPNPLERLRQRAEAIIIAGHGPRHLVLCVASHNLLGHSGGLDIITNSTGCTFSEGTFALDKDDGSNVLFGLDDMGDSQLVGGTFTFRGLHHTTEHQALCKALRLAVYIQLSLMLEQSLLKDLNVPLKYPRPRPKMISSSSTPHPSPLTSPDHGTPLDESSPSPSRTSFLPNGLFGIFARKQLGKLTRSNSAISSPSVSRTGSASLDLDRGETSPREHNSRPSFDASGMLRRLSVLGERATAFRKPNPSVPETPDLPFASSLKQIERGRSCLSTSSGVVFDPPMLLTHLAEREKQRPKLRLKGDEKVGLGSLLGWEGREVRAKRMTGIAGFVRHQEISILYSHHTPMPPPETAPPAEEGSVATASVLSNLPQSGMKLCGKPHWVTYQFYSKDTKADRPLGDALKELITTSRLPCDQRDCLYKRGQHELRLIHGSLRIVLRVESKDVEEEEESNSNEIECWLSCAVCGLTTPKAPLSDAAWLYSFGKFLELLIYSPMISILAQSPCSHMAAPSEAPKTLPPDMRFNIIRWFSMGARGTVSISLSTIEDIFELRVPRLQVQRIGEKLSRTTTETSSGGEASVAEEEEVIEDEKRALRREIRQWWQGIADHIDSLEEALTNNVNTPVKHKSLPRLPSSDDAYDVFEDDSLAFSPRAPSTSPVGQSQGEEDGYFTGHIPDTSLGQTASLITAASSEAPESSESTLSTPTAGPSVPPKDDSQSKLSQLRHRLQQLEQSLYIQLASTPISSLNDVRRSFLASAKGTEKRLTAWQKKHLNSKVALTVQLEGKEEPEWWRKGCHAVPGANVIVREDDWGSIIAFTISTSDYHKELANITFNRAPTTQTSPASDISSTSGGTSSFFSVPASYKFFSATTLPDPDKDDPIWTEPEPCSAVITRKEHIRDPTSILSLRDVLRKSAAPNDSGSVKASMTAGTSQPTLIARARPDIGVNMQPADGLVSVTTEETVEKLLHELEHAETRPPSRATSRPPSFVGSDKESTAGDTWKAKGPPAASFSSKSESTVGKHSRAASIVSQATVSDGPLPPPPPPVPQKDPPKVPPKNGTPATSPSPENTSSSFASAFASHLGTAVRYVVGSNPPNRPTSPAPTKHHGLLAGIDFEAIDDRPHIKYDWTIGKRLKFSCTVYFAKQFDSMRRRCGIEESFVKSLSKSTNWAADGGKSRSNFWKTSDNKFIIKTLVNAWNVADLQALIDLAPSYFRYVESTASKATALAKLLGFYTIEIRNLETGNVQSKVDLLVMENLFYDLEVSKTFDLKGIPGRKVKATNKAGGTTKTLFDGEWIEDQRRTLMLVRPHSKRVLREAIRSDADFLAKSNIMDYSLLLGIDEGKKQIACGLVDTIGSYTFAKTLEYKAKHGLQSGTGKEVTVIPPADYQERFVNALDGYFVACPDKWSKPLDETKIITDPDQLPSVL